ncbi:MAG: glucosaminidase domain-containing protein [Dysgonamonadaceae bacterium]|jgi:LysM repeat protein|nr:glucosaminidase domain-containing protein [Dysgonamonadaceae bacterium]
MKTYKYVLSFLFVFFVAFNPLSAQKQNASFVEYIEKYKHLAIRHMKEYHIPASITLAQGILESGAGKSQFTKESNNHFGIKCGSNWKGSRMYRDDDIPRECFRAYKKAEDSYLDHSLFLLERSRYAPLFALDITDYRAWATGLQKYGYATDKAYANKLIKLIEDYELYQYDTNSKIKNKSKFKTRSKSKPAPLLLKRDVYKTFDLIYVIAGSNDSYDKIAEDMGFRVKDLLKYNEVPENFPLFKGDIVYLEKKKKKADKPYFEHVVKIGESMHSISQKYGLQLSRLYEMNKKKEDYVPIEGDVLKLR